MSINKLQAVSDLARALDQAEHHLPRVYDDKPHIAEPFDFLMFTQTWADTSLGFGGTAGQGFTDSTVVVCWRQRGEYAAVFVGGRLAYPVHDEDPRRADFWTRAFNHHVTGAAFWQRDCPHRTPENSNVCDFCGRGQPVRPAPPKHEEL